jgi:hypothetical protein
MPMMYDLIIHDRLFQNPYILVILWWFFLFRTALTSEVERCY